MTNNTEQNESEKQKKQDPNVEFSEGDERIDSTVSPHPDQKGSAGGNTSQEGAGRSYKHKEEGSGNARH
jgi:hypothetical protein